MRIIIIFPFIFSIFIPHVICQVRDSIYLNLEQKLVQYEQSENIYDLYMIGMQLPMSSYIHQKDEMSDLDFEMIRKFRTELYIDWVAKILDIGYDIDFDPNDLRNQCIRNFAIYSDDAESLELRNKENCEKREMNYFYIKAMSNFGCYYKWSFSKRGRITKRLKEIIRNWCKVNLLSPEREESIIEAFRKEVKNNRCTF